MENCIIPLGATQWLIYALYIFGMALLVCGWFKFRFDPLWLLMILTSPLPLYPTYFGLKRQYLRRVAAPSSQIERASRQFRVSMWFVVVALVTTSVISITFYYQAMNVEPITVDVNGLMQALFIGLLSVIVLYALLLFVVSKRKS